MRAEVPLQQPGSYLDRLNPDQRRAATHGHILENGGVGAGPLLVIAGAGTGKTMTLAHRVAHLVLNGVDPAEILLLTFTRRAAEVMLKRATSIVRGAIAESDDQSARPVKFGWAGTFHSVANRVLRRYAATAGLDASFSVLDRGDAADLIDLVRHEHKLSRVSRRFPKKDTCLAIYSRRVNTQKPLNECLQESFPWCAEWEEELRQLFRDYVERKQKNAVLDYDDLLLYWFHLCANSAIAAEMGSAFSHILVDEYQDTNALQSGIVAALKPAGEGVTVVGDDAQSIYSFRAADVDNILGFPDQFIPSARVVNLERNYRSTQPILDSANALINESERHYRKTLYTTKKSQQKPVHVSVEDADAETDYVIQTVLANRETGLRLMDQSVLFRNSHHSDRLELELIRRNIPYVKYGGLKFLEAAHVKDLLAIMKWADNSRNQVAAFRVLKLLPGMGPGNAERCFDHVAAADFRLAALKSFRPPAAAAEWWPALAELLTDLSADQPTTAWQTDVQRVREWYRPHLERLHDSPEQREADLEQLQQVAGKYATRERFLTELTLDPPQSTGDLAGDPLLDEDFLILSTVHSAKGQEWDCVFVLNVTDGNFPSEFSTGKPASIEEERRLLYVAMTRARNDLHLLVPLKFQVTQQHRHGDKHVYGARSRFLSDAVTDTLEQRFHASPDSNLHVLRPRTNVQLDVGAKLRDMW